MVVVATGGEGSGSRSSTCCFSTFDRVERVEDRGGGEELGGFSGETGS